jgi:hypothetical protein
MNDDERNDANIKDQLEEFWKRWHSKLFIIMFVHINCTALLSFTSSTYIFDVPYMVKSIGSYLEADEYRYWHNFLFIKKEDILTSY